MHVLRAFRYMILTICGAAKKTRFSALRGWKRHEFRKSAAQSLALGTSLFLRHFAGAVLAGARNAKIVQFLSGLDGRGQPARFQATSGPGFAGIFRIAEFGGDL